MIPCCRTLEEADCVLAVIAEHGLVQGDNGLQVYMMAAIPSNVMLAEEFTQRFDRFPLVLRHLPQVAYAASRKVDICGQAPSDYLECAAFLVEAGIDSISLNADSVIAVKQDVANTEKRVG